MPFTEDFSIFTDPVLSGSVATYTPSGSSSSAGRAVNGIFDRESEDVLGMEGSGPTFSCAADDVTEVAHGDGLVIDGASYVVRGVKPDGTGWTRLTLELTDG